MRPRNLTLLAVPLAALAIAGCGGGGDDDSTTAPATTAATTTALTKEELIARGDAICAEVNAAVGTAGLSTSEGASPVSAVADLYIGMVESLKGLGAPEDTTGYPEFITAAEQLSATEGEAKLADEREDSTALSAAQTQATSDYAAFQSAAENYGFEDCGQEPTTPASTPSESTESSAAPETPETEESVEPEAEAAPEEVEEVAPETGGGAGAAPPAEENSGGGSTSGGVGPG